MKKLVSMILVFGFMMFSVIGVKADTIALKSVDTILAKIRQDQNITNSDPIDIAKVTSARLEELGDSVMEQVIGNTAVHDRMDIALGGDGSTSLTNVHIRVGYDYLAGIPITMMTFMGAGGMMGGFGYPNLTNGLPVYGGMMNGFVSQFGYGSMMGAFGWLWMIVGLLGLIGLITGIVYMVTRSASQQRPIATDHALNILKERYARGLISREEYLSVMDALK